MARSGEEIQHALLTFGRRWVEYAGSERAEAQTFLNELFARTGRSIGRTPDELQRFLMQAVWCMFAEDLQMLRDYPFQKIVRRLIADRTRSSSAELGLLFRVLNQKGSHNRKDVLEGTTYVNGELFAQPANVDLDSFELALLDEASQFDWRLVNPTTLSAHGTTSGAMVGEIRRIGPSLRHSRSARRP